MRYLTTKYFFNERSIVIPGGTVASNTLTTTASVAVGDTSATLTYKWTTPTATVATTFSDGEIRNVNYVYNSTAITWTDPIYGSSFTTTAVIAAAATSATLSTAWAYPTGTYSITFSTGETKSVTLTLNSTAVSWAGGLSGAALARIRTSVCTISLAVGSQESFPLPYNIKTIVDMTLNVGSTKYTLKETPSRPYWDMVNFVPFTSDIPQYYYIWNKRIYVFPNPSSNNNTITINFKARLTDLSRADYTTGTITLTNGSTTVTGSGTTFTTNMVGMWLQASTAPGGDNNWYEIATFNTTTSLDLVNPYQGIGGATLTYIIGEAPILGEDYQDLALYRACKIYFTTRVPDPARAELFDNLYQEGMLKLDAEFGSKSWSVAITPQDDSYVNPNLITRNIG